MNTCSHCHEPANAPLLVEENPSLLFCCQGCLTVYNILHQKGLDAYYTIKNDTGFFKKRAPVEVTVSDYSYFDDPVFNKDYIEENNASEKVLEVYLEGIHCLACLWLIENLGKTIPNVKDIKLEMNRSVAIVTINPDGKFSPVLKEFNLIGYKPHPLKKNQNTMDLKRKEERSMLLKIGIAGASSGNIMLYAISLYGGATHEFIHLFHSLTVVFAVPVLTYCSYPFYESAYKSLKAKSINIDVPISLALLVGSFSGFISYFLGGEDNYFDSLTALVFLLLLSRYALFKIQEKGISTNDLQFAHTTESAFKAIDDNLEEFVTVPVHHLNIGDRVKVKVNDLIPADGKIVRGQSKINNSLLTGESQPLEVREGEDVYSGAINLGHDFIMQVEVTGQQTKLGKILKTVEQGWSLKSPVAQLTNTIAKLFVVVICFLSVVLFMIRLPGSGINSAFLSAMTLLIVTCPCALAIATPLAFYRSLSKAAQNGIIIKSDEALEKIAQVENIFIDKTGTITHGQPHINSFTITENTKHDIFDVVFNLEANSMHPTAKALMRFVEKSGNKLNRLAISNYREILGVGIEGQIDGINYAIKENKIFAESKVIAHFSLNDSVRSDSLPTLVELKKMKLNLKMLSGDSKAITERIGIQNGFHLSEIYSHCTPESKAAIIADHKKTLMIGDGANDAIAFKHADVGVAVLGAMDISLKACDVYLTNPGLVPLRNLIVLSQETMKVIKRNLVLSLLYNSLSVIATFAGVISPLVAAIIMPVSSLTVAVSVLIGTKKLRTLWKS